MTKTVCIIGAGPSGLVAAKSLLHDLAPGSFKVTIFDGQSRIGGLWPASRHDNAGLVHPLMTANQSKHTVQFSDFAWRSSDPEFPKAWQVGSYLERYLKEYGGAEIHLDHKVVKTELQDGGSWKVYTDAQVGSEGSIFDYLLIATGFFGKPLWPEQIAEECDVPVIHSSEYRDIESLLAKSTGSGDKILVVGGQMSGIEITGTVATHLSSLVHSPGEKSIQDAERYTIHHVTQRPAWTFPLYTSAKPDAQAPPFLPVDLPSYNLALRTHPLDNSQGHITADAARSVNVVLRSVVGTDQSEFSSETKVDDLLCDEPPLLAMSPHYLDFVRSGLVKVHKGRLGSLTKDVATVSSPDRDETIDRVAAVILATGFDPSPSLSFLPTTVLKTLSHSAAHPNQPLALAFHGTHHPSLPSLGFVGFYRSPYWGVMEMQARLVAQLFQTHTEGNMSARSSILSGILAKDDSISRTLALRDDPRCSQFPMGDYAFIMQELASALELEISPPPSSTPSLANGLPMDILTPARYLSRGATESQQRHAAENLESTYKTANAGLLGQKFISGAVFRSLLGEWSLERDLVSKLPSHPSGRFVGTAKFLLRAGTADGRNAKHSSSEAREGSSSDSFESGEDIGLEYLYIEDGEFTAAGTDMRFRASRRYVWRYDELDDKLSVWFTRTDDPSRADYLFHEVEFESPSSLNASDENSLKARGQQERQVQSQRWKARSSHLCVEDLYNVHYDFSFKAVNLKEWRLGYSVRGPKKDYTIDGVYKRRSLT
ncbi:hypothetical protein F5Y18DRAFT_312716 [Xylariaceae sp. FL1019]|nr:hypothetical protein F5Y18DRAFT_312716 [Xylariaceae sp. FL1019]